MRALYDEMCISGPYGFMGDATAAEFEALIGPIIPDSRYIEMFLGPSWID